jgi:eukaryotic-like serine/threonine-protein kinase
MTAEHPTGDLPEDVASGRAWEAGSVGTPSLIGKAIGRYHIRRVIASGGMGTVYEAVQESPRRTVALKVMKHGIASRSALRRFEYESQILARLRHPGIAQVYEAGTHDDGSGAVPYFAMDYIPSAKPITHYARSKKLTTKQRLELFAKVCDAVHHGHQKGIIHRDLKPGNILVDSSGQSKVIDFGGARATDSDMAVTTLQTDVGQLIGTLQYMSPEQCDADPHDLDTRSDVYALGVVLYELLCEQLPYDVTKVALYEAARVIREHTPARPSSFNKTLRGDVETIALKALEKDRTRRYPSITARRASMVYHVRTFARRNKPLVGGVAAVFIVLLAGLIAATTLYLQAEEARADAVAARDAEAEQRRIAEANQARAVAEAERAEREAERAEAEAQRALAAEAEEKSRAEELEKVAEFQASQLADIDVQTVGVRLRAGLLGKTREALERRGLESEQAEAELENLQRTIAGVNFTDAALKLLDENIFERALAAIDTQFPADEQPLLRARLLQTLADTMRNIGLLQRASAPQVEALDTRRRTLGEEHLDTLGSINNLGILLRAQGKLAEAEGYFRQALETRRRLLGEEHPDTLGSINNLGGLLRDQGKLAEAEPFYRAALKGHRRTLGEEHADTLGSINNLGILLRAQGKLAEAEPFYRETLEVRRRLLGDEHPHTLLSIHSMGVLLRGLGKLSEAEPYHRGALEGYRRTLGDEHTSTLNSINNMGNLLRDQGRLTEAEGYYREALERSRRVLGDDHPDTLTSVGSMGLLLRTQGKLAEAEPYYRQALEGYRRTLGDDHPHTLTAIGNLGSLLQDEGKLAEAEGYYREALEARRRTLGDDHPATLVSINNMGVLLQDQGQLAEAEGYYRETLEARRRTLGDEHPSTLSSINNRGALLRDIGQLEEADRLGAEAVATARRVLPEGHWSTAVFLGQHARTMAAMERFAEAEERFLEAHVILDAALGPDHERTTANLERLADLYGAWHAAEPDAGYDAKAAEWRAKLPLSEPDDAAY